MARKTTKTKRAARPRRKGPVGATVAAEVGAALRAVAEEQRQLGRLMDRLGQLLAARGTL